MIRILNMYCTSGPEEDWLVGPETIVVDVVGRIELIHLAFLIEEDPHREYESSTCSDVVMWWR